MPSPSFLGKVNLFNICLDYFTAASGSSKFFEAEMPQSAAECNRLEVLSSCERESPRYILASSILSLWKQKDCHGNL